MWGAHWTINLEKQGIPAVYIVDEPFQADVQITCEKEGLPLLRRVVVPHPCGDVPDEQLPSIVSRLIEALNLPLTHDEQFPRAKGSEKPSRIVFTGALKEVNQFFYEKGWSDGLPIIPPTEKAVQAMLKGTSHLPDEIVTANMLPESLTVSIENVATVGVMAGCEPEYMPVLLGMTEAFANDLFSSTVRSTCSFSFSVLVNGPMANQIGMNSGINALGSGTGNKANATIGRFLRLAIICLGGSRSGLNDMSSIGNPSKYSFAFSENEQRSPWEPFHVSSGFRPDESVVTIMSGGFSHSGPFGHLDLDRIARRIATYELPNGALIIMDPMSAKKLSQKGYTKQAAEEYIWSHATSTMAEFKNDDFFYPAFIEPFLKPKTSSEAQPLWPSHYLDLSPHEIIQVYPRGQVRIVVVGGETNPLTQVWQMARPSSSIIDKWR
jgi:hypothetical protein